MKKIFSLLALILLINTGVFAQIDWNSAGNNSTGISTTNNILGTISGTNIPIRFWTNGLNRMRLNEDVSYAINGATGTNINRNGYLLLGQSNNFVSSGTPIYNTGAFSLLHLNGYGSSAIDELGYRNWMRTGITLTGNRDLSYFGLRQVGGEEDEDLTETTIAWADDGPGSLGPDDLVFRFLGGAPGATTSSNDFTDQGDVDGINIARFTPNGQIGFGNTFGLTADHANYVRPQNLLHMSLNGNRATFLQITNEGMGQTATDGLHIGYDAGNLEAQIIQRENANLTLFNGSVVPRFTIAPNGNVGAGSVFTPAAQPQNLFHVNNTANNASFVQISNESGTGQTASDGLLVGYPATSSTNLEARINQQQDDRLSFYTNTSDGGGERMRITHIDALNNGVNFNPGGLPRNRTRIGISHNPASPVTRPLSLLHLGYNTESILGDNNGWRSWMDVGMYVSENSEHVYLGLKNEGEDRKDAVLSWGDNQVDEGAFGTGPDNFRMIFTSTPFALAGGTAPATGANGLEGLRMTPSESTGVFTGIGGDPTAPNNYFGGIANPTATLEVNAWGSSPTTANGAPVDPAIGGTPSGLSGLRFTDLSSASTPQLNPGTGVLSVDAQGDVIYVPGSNAPEIGNYCTAPTQSPLLGNFEVPLNDFNYYFSGQGTNPNTNNIGSSVGIGLPCGDPIPYAKLHVLQSVLNAQDNISFAGYFENNATGSTAFQGSYTAGVYATSIGDAFHNYGGSFHAVSTRTAATQRATGVEGYAKDAYDSNTGVIGEGEGGDYNYGVYGKADIGGISYAIYGEAPGTSGPLHYAGYFDGDIDVIGTIFNTSDIKLKSNIKDLTSNSATALISKLNPKNYEYKTADFPSMSLPKGNQYGLIAQEVETVLPQLVKDAIHPPKRDKKGNIIHPAVPYKAVSYTGFIPVLIGAVKEQQHTIDSLKEVIDERLSSLENRLNGCCGNPNNYKTDPNETNTESINRQTVELSNLQTIVLDQNVPNPFAEQTIIRYLLPDDIKTAEIIFHDAQGKLIKQAQISTRGRGEINVYAQDLSSGVYTYTLVADGNVIDTKRMVKK